MKDRSSLLIIGATCLVGAGCHRTAQHAESGNIAGGGGDRCAEARLITTPATVTGDLTARHDDFNGRVAVTGYSWAGRDEFYAMDLQAGQTVTFTVDDRGGFDSGIYVFRNCADIAGSVVGGLDTNPQRPYVFAAPTAGRYYVALDSWIANTGGPYTLTVAPGGTPTTTAAVAPTAAAAPTAVPGGTGATTLSVAGNPNFGRRSVTPGFVPDPMNVDVVSGGNLGVSNMSLGAGCVGYVTSQPDVNIQLSAQDTMLRLYVTSDQDTTLIVNDAAGGWHCNDDSFGGHNPSVDLSNTPPGLINVWIGSYQSGVQAHGTLHITELASNHP